MKRWMIAMGLALAIAALAGCSGGGGSSGGGSSSGGSSGTTTPATTLPVNTYVTGTVSASQPQSYQFTTGTATKYPVYLYQGNLGQPTSALHIGPSVTGGSTSFNCGSAGVEPNLDNCPAIASSQVTLDAATTYTIELSTADSASDPYTLAVVDESASDGTLGSFTPITLGVAHNTFGGVADLTFTTAGAGSYSIQYTSTSALEISLFSDSGLTSLVSRCISSFLIGNTPQTGTCVYTGLATGTSYYVSIQGNSPATDYYWAAQITVAAGATGTNEGSTGSPVSYTLGAPRSSTVAALGNSYYTFTPGSAGTYTIALTSADSDLGWSLYSTADFSTTLVETCDRSVSSLSESCSLALSNVPYYLKVTEKQQGAANFMLTVNSGTGGNEGSTSAPVVISSVPSASHTIDGGKLKNGAIGQSFYEFTTSSTSGTRTITITGTHAILNWTLYSNTSFTTLVTACFGNGFVGQSNATQCVATVNPSTIYYLEVDNGSTGVPDTFTINVTPL